MARTGEKVSGLAICPARSPDATKWTEFDGLESEQSKVGPKRGYTGVFYNPGMYGALFDTNYAAIHSG
jgi:hypothetical protein